jgi:prepilin-type processing-associated H-X9-DG protein
MEQTTLATMLPSRLSDPSVSTDIYEANPTDNLDGTPLRRPERDFQSTLARRVMRCPSSIHNINVEFAFNSIENNMKGNYVGCFGGDTYANCASYGGIAPKAGVFNLARVVKFPSGARIGAGKGTKVIGIQDGSSNTIMFSEVLPFGIALDAGSTSSPSGTNQDGRGAVLFPGPGGNMFVTFTAPNSPTQDRMMYCDNRIGPETPGNLVCERAPFSISPDSGRVWAAARSFHSGGVNVAMADGSVRFFTNSILLATWQALGTKSGGEVVSFD